MCVFAVVASRRNYKVLLAVSGQRSGHIFDTCLITTVSVAAVAVHQKQRTGVSMMEEERLRFLFMGFFFFGVAFTLESIKKFFNSFAVLPRLLHFRAVVPTIQ